MRDPDRARSFEASAGADAAATDSPRHRTSRLPSSRSWTSTLARARLRRPLTGPSCRTWPPNRIVLSDATIRPYLKQQIRSRSSSAGSGR